MSMKKREMNRHEYLVLMILDATLCLLEDFRLVGIDRYHHHLHIMNESRILILAAMNFH